MKIDTHSVWSSSSQNKQEIKPISNTKGENKTIGIQQLLLLLVESKHKICDKNLHKCIYEFA